MVSGKISKTIGLLCKLQSFLPRPALITICKALYNNTIYIIHYIYLYIYIYIYQIPS